MGLVDLLGEECGVGMLWEDETSLEVDKLGGVG